MSKLLLYVEIRFHLTKTQMRAILFTFMLFFNDKEAQVPVYGLIITVNIVIDLLEAKPSVSTLISINKIRNFTFAEPKRYSDLRPI